MGVELPDLDWIKRGILGKGCVWINVGWYKYDKEKDEQSGERFDRCESKHQKLIKEELRGAVSDPAYGIAQLCDAMEGLGNAAPEEPEEDHILVTEEDKEPKSN